METDQEKILHMKEGGGPYSYANNSLLQKTIMRKAKPIIEENVKELYHALQPECLMIADMGCSSGPNAFFIISEIMDVIDKPRRSLNRQVPNFAVFLNDLPGNDYNTLFSLLPSFLKQMEEEKGSDFGSCFVSGTPKSFYGRVFPNHFLHFVHSSSCLHWLSQVPKGLKNEKGEALNKGNICIAKSSPPEIAKAYFIQFKEDFTKFLRSRAREMVPGGLMVLTFLGRLKSNDPELIFELLGSTIYDMVLEGLIEEEKVDNFNMPLYSPTIEEVKQLVGEVEESSSISLNKLETFTVDWSIEPTRNLEERAKMVANYIRAAVEPLLTTNLEFDGTTMDDLFVRFETKIKQHIAVQTSEHFNILISITKGK